MSNGICEGLFVSLTKDIILNELQKGRVSIFMILRAFYISSGEQNRCGGTHLYLNTQ